MDALKFNLDQDNRPLKETINLSSLENSPFKEQYLNALSEIESYLSTIQDKSSDRDMDFANNVFAFTGDRGSGKTSCMVSVGGFLTTNKELRSEFQDKYPHISKTNFYTLDLMDPSYFDAKHNILSLFLAKIYSRFQKLSINNESIQEYKKMAFLASLTKAQKHAHLLIDDEGDTLITNKVEELECLSVAVDLKEDIKNLVDNFLDCLEGQYQILILRIDDIDLNAKEAGVMSELIRKYFIIPNLLVLTALKMNQLYTIKLNEFSKSFSLRKDNPQVIEMAERYLTKLFPHGQRIFLPDIEELLTRKLILTSASKTWTYPSVQQCVLELIFNKTRYLFYNSPIHASYIIPRNLRDLRQMIKLLITMDDYNEIVDEDNNVIKKEKYNQALFKKYLSEVWIQNNLSEEKYEVARRILYTDELMRLNSYVIQALESRYSDNIYVNDCSEEDNSICNISLGDVLGVIEYKYNKYNDEKEQKFYFFIKTVYSIRLYEAYNKQSDLMKALASGKVVETSTQIPSEILRDSQYSNIRDFDKIVSGYYVNVQMQPILPKDLALDRRILDGKRLKDLMLFCASDFESSANVNFVRLLEFFMLSVSHTKLLDSDFRKQDVVAYNEPVSLDDDVVFDLGAFFFNLTRIEDCYARFSGYAFMPDGTDLIKRIMESKRSLYNDFKEVVYERYSPDHTTWSYYQQCNKDKEDLYYKSRWLSYSSIRNVEVLQDFFKYIQKSDIKRNRSDRENLAEFFYKCASYSIRLYNLERVESGTSSDEIQFGFLSKVANLLHRPNLEGRFVQIFGENPQMSNSSTVEAHL